MSRASATPIPAASRSRLARLVCACLLALLPLAAGAEEFAAPTVLRPPFPEGFEGSGSFGARLAIDRGTLAVAAPGILGGTVYIYERQRLRPGEWAVVQSLEGRALFGAGAEPGFGNGPLALEGDTLVTGYLESERLFVFHRYRSGWVLRRTLTPGLPGSAFGAAISLSGQRLAVGAPGNNQVRIYERNAGGPDRWGLVATLGGKVSAALAGCLDPARPVPGFGASVALSGRTLAVGAFDFDNPALFGKVPRNNGTYIFELDRNRAVGWRQITTVAPPRGCDAVEGPMVSLDGPDLLIDLGVMRSSWELYERNLGGASRWGRRTRRSPPDALLMTGAALRGNLLAIADRHASAAWVYARDVPARNGWGLVAKLPNDRLPEVPCCPGGKTTVVAIGPREVVTGHPLEGTVLLFPRAPIQADGFETGDTSAWSGRQGPVAVVAPGLRGSSAALEVTVGGEGRASFVATNRPRREPTVSIGFTLLPNEVDLADRSVEILRLYAGKPVLRLLLEGSPRSPGYTLRLQVRRRGGAWGGVGAITHLAGNDEWPISVEYKAPSATGAADGFARFDANGLHVRQARNLDMDRLPVNRVVLGLPVGSPAITAGSFLVDDFEMHR